MVWDNFQRGQELRDQRGGRSNEYLIGTVEAAHHMVSFLQFQSDDCNIMMTYDWHQRHPLPLGMRAYEACDHSSAMFGTNVFMNHANLHIPDTPCFTRDCVHQYEYIMSLQKIYLWHEPENISATWAGPSPNSLNLLGLELTLTISIWSKITVCQRNQRSFSQAYTDFNKKRSWIGTIVPTLSRSPLTLDLLA